VQVKQMHLKDNDCGIDKQNIAKRAGLVNRIVRGLTADVTNEEDDLLVVSEAIREFGAIHILVNNAGRGMRFVSENFLGTPTKFWQTDPAVWRMIIDTNVTGPFLMARAVLPHMLKQHWGRIINISMNYETMRRAGFSPYGPSKAALESETIIWAQDLAGTGVTVNSLLPGGATDTGNGPRRYSASGPQTPASSGDSGSTAPVAGVRDGE
jgi:NAD(P)-dependent dehydrogenase (short-subunit alcohol dehydrogenase family)